MAQVILQESGRAGLLSRASFLPPSYHASVLSSCWFYPHRPFPGSACPSALSQITIPSASCPLQKVWGGGCATDLRSHRFSGHDAHSVNTFSQHNATEVHQCANHLARDTENSPTQQVRVMGKSNAHSQNFGPCHRHYLLSYGGIADRSGPQAKIWQSQRQSRS